MYSDEKDTDMLIRKSAEHKNDFIPDSYKKKLLLTLECLPDKATGGQITEEADIKIINNRHKIEFRAIASAAAAVVLLFGGYSLLSKVITPGEKPEITDSSAIVATEATTSSSTVKNEKKAVIAETTCTTIGEVTTEETLSETNNDFEEIEKFQAIPAPDEKELNEDKKIHEKKNDDPVKAGKAEEAKGAKDDKGAKGAKDDPVVPEIDQAVQDPNKTKQEADQLTERPVIPELKNELPKNGADGKNEPEIRKGPAPKLQ